MGTILFRMKTGIERNFIPKVSVIVPVYKVEKYLPESLCVE